MEKYSFLSWKSFPIFTLKKQKSTQIPSDIKPAATDKFHAEGEPNLLC